MLTGPAARQIRSLAVAGWCAMALGLGADAAWAQSADGPVGLGQADTTASGSPDRSVP